MTESVYRFQIRLVHFINIGKNMIFGQTHLLNVKSASEIGSLNQPFVRGLVNTSHRYLSIYPVGDIDIEIKNRLLKVCYVPATSAASSKAFFFLSYCGHLLS